MRRARSAARTGRAHWRESSPVAASIGMQSNGPQGRDVVRTAAKEA
ncbi:hypothetical protein C7S16_2834 [Burkholderia thailandensis]|uniref:Uncharacterized protein n=1 Tax=Burkholderia thailandensis TaxID=57975 RepID=A0AAW9CU83_BURTH|nr:hypothetical protein [Burkholderia thailandensis]MDW9254220.1 hypothetical protein [Burkholderia thailandensis]